MWKLRLQFNTCLFSILFLSICGIGIAFSDENKNEPISVIQCPEQSTSLVTRWKWAMDQVVNRRDVEDVRIGCSASRLMGENSYSGRWPVDPDKPTFSELIYGVRVEIPKTTYSNKTEQRQIEKEVAYLFEIDRASKKIVEIQTSNIELNADMNGSLLWLGKVEAEQLAQLLQSLYIEAKENDLRCNLIRQIGSLHIPQTIAFLDDVLKTEKSYRVREEATDELGQHSSQESLTILLRTVRDDTSVCVRKKAVGSIQCLELPAAEQALMEIAQNGKSIDVREEAIEQIGNRTYQEPKTSVVMITCLVQIIDRDKQERILRKALETLSHIEHDESLRQLVRIAETHANLQVRQQAIEELRNKAQRQKNNISTIAQSLSGIINKKGDLEKIQRKALEALTGIEDPHVLTVLIDTARTHSNPLVRREAIEELRNIAFRNEKDIPTIVETLSDLAGKTDDPEDVRWTALEALSQIENGESLDRLIQIANANSDSQIRRKAIEELRNKSFRKENDPAKIIQCLTEIIDRKNELDSIRWTAFEALSQNESADSLDRLIQTAKTHFDIQIRRKAIEELRNKSFRQESDSAKIVQCLSDIINLKEELENIRWKALEALTQIEKKEALDRMIQIAKSHFDSEIRQKTLEELRNKTFREGDVSDEIIQCLSGIVNQKDEKEAIQIKALEALAGIENETVADVLITIGKNHANTWIRRSAIDESGRFISEEQKMRLDQEFGDLEDQETIELRKVETLTKAGNKAALDIVIHIAQTHANPRVRQEAVRELRERSEETVLQCWANILNKPDELEEIQEEALDCLKEYDSPEALGSIVKAALTHPSHRIREEAIDRLADKKSNEVVPCLTNVISNPYELEEIQREALERLADLKTKESGNQLIQIAKSHPSIDIREEAIDRLEDYSSLETIECLTGIINKDGELEGIWERALDRLADFETKETQASMIKIAETHPDYRIRERAIDRLRDVDAAIAQRCLLHIIDKSNERGDIQRDALDRLADLSLKETADSIVHIAGTHPDPRIREDAIDKLRECPDAKIINALVDIAGKPEELDYIQRKALETLCEIKNERAVDGIIKQAETHTDFRIREKAIDELKAFPTSKVIVSIVETLDKNDEFEEVQRTALDTLVRMENDKATDQVVRIVKTHPNPWICREAIDRLRDRISPQVIECFMNVIDDPDELEENQREALGGLRGIDDQKVLNYVKKIAETHPNREIRKEALDVLGQ